MADTHRLYEIRCPLHGFITLSDWEWQIIAQPAFQRLRRIRQLAWTDHVYPGAMHTRFEHSLGVMHLASRVYDQVALRSSELLRTEFGYQPAGIDRDRTLVRLTALLHDVGHGPFSHAGEDLLPLNTKENRKYTHEDYSSAIIREKLRDVIENHPLNQTNHAIKAEEIVSLLEGKTQAENKLFWRELVTGQVDADRMDYLLRDSYHAGVDYGRFDWRRLIHTMEAIPGAEGQRPRLGVSEGGWHAAESLVLARYFMFTQVYFHKTRVAFDHHLRQALKEMLPGGQFPKPEGGALDAFLAWDDWRVLGELAAGRGGEHGQRLACRNHYREIYHTSETPTTEQLEELEKVRAALGELVRAEESAEKSWYKVGPADIPVLSESRIRRMQPLSAHSPVVANMKPIRKVMLYARPEEAEVAREKLAKLEVSP